MITIESIGRETTDWRAKWITVARIGVTILLIASTHEALRGVSPLWLTVACCLVWHYLINEAVKNL